jgi:hypothetical protein
MPSEVEGGMRRSVVIVAGLLILAGAVFVGQGTGLIRSSSSMTDDIRWAWIGGGMVVVGAGLAWWERRRASV